MDVSIYKPEKSAMQSGRGKTNHWILEYNLPTPRRPEPLMGWVSADDTLNQVKLKFHTAEEAVAFATKNGWTYTVQPDQARLVRPRNYSDNFKYRPPAGQTTE